MNATRVGDTYTQEKYLTYTREASVHGLNTIYIIIPALMNTRILVKKGSVIMIDMEIGINKKAETNIKIPTNNKVNEFPTIIL